MNRFFIFLFFTPILAFSILSPLNQSLKEIWTVLESPELKRYFSEYEEITDILRTEEGFLVVSNEKQVRVEVIYKNTHHIGPRQFELKFLIP